MSHRQNNVLSYRYLPSRKATWTFGLFLLSTVAPAVLSYDYDPELADQINYMPVADAIGTGIISGGASFGLGKFIRTIKEGHYFFKNHDISKERQQRNCRHHAYVATAITATAICFGIGLNKYLKEKEEAKKQWQTVPQRHALNENSALFNPVQEAYSDTDFVFNKTQPTGLTI